MLQNEYLFAKIGFDTAENEPSKVWRRRRLIVFKEEKTQPYWRKRKKPLPRREWLERKKYKQLEYVSEKCHVNEALNGIYDNDESRSQHQNWTPSFVGNKNSEKALRKFKEKDNRLEKTHKVERFIKKENHLYEESRAVLRSPGESPLKSWSCDQVLQLHWYN